MNLLLELGFSNDNIMLVDRNGVVSTKSENLSTEKLTFAADTDKKTLTEAISGSDVFIGVGRGNLVTQEMVESMAKRPIIFSLSNPDPDISTAEVYD